MIPVILFFFGDAFNERAVAVAIFFGSIFGNNEWTVSRRNMCQTRYVYIFSVPFTTRYLCVCVVRFFVVVDELRDREYEVTNTVTTLNKHKQWHVCYIKKKRNYIQSILQNDNSKCMFPKEQSQKISQIYCVRRNSLNRWWILPFMSMFIFYRNVIKT